MSNDTAFTTSCGCGRKAEKVGGGREGVRESGGERVGRDKERERDKERAKAKEVGGNG